MAPATSVEHDEIGTPDFNYSLTSPNSRLTYWLEYISSKNKHENFHLKNRIKTIHSLISHLKDKKKLISDNCFTVFKVYFDLIYCRR